jgi:protein subunit release factor A
VIIKKVITPVGASIFENYMKQDKKDIDSLYEAITNKLSKEYNEKTKKIKMIKTILKNHYENKLNINISAEIKTISKIHETLKEDLDVYLSPIVLDSNCS